MCLGASIIWEVQRKRDSRVASESSDRSSCASTLLVMDLVAQVPLDTEGFKNRAKHHGTWYHWFSTLWSQPELGVPSLRSQQNFRRVTKRAKLMA